uniref:Uncharacterized protein n=1 Tax=Siphoviridae sp. ctZHD14 TaxID=2827891 RepID=A0A8S5SWV9_9CAUD|nr:MAG TPA: hypothetical protein [Siphoviridae sp. ctZHD14]
MEQAFYWCNVSGTNKRVKDNYTQMRYTSPEGKRKIQQKKIKVSYERSV